jgi:hypothetical protein
MHGVPPGGMYPLSGKVVRFDFQQVAQGLFEIKDTHRP